jgi:type I protein arginine methyltransferase
MIPRRDELRVALVDRAKSYKDYEQPWLSNAYGMDLSAGHRYAVNTQSKLNLKPSDLISEAQLLADLDYASIYDTDLDTTVDLIATRAGTGHGFVLWFDAELFDGIGFSNAPGQPDLIYGQTFFPFERPFDLASGDRVSVRFRARHLDGTYVWTWDSALYRGGRNSAETQYAQSSFLSKVMSARSLRTRASDYVPPQRPSQDVDLLCLSLIDGRRTLQEIATELSSKFPETFPSLQKALDHATRLASRYE